MKTFIIIYVIFLLTLWIIFLINKKKLNKKLIIMYLIYRNILLLNIVLSFYFFRWEKSNLGYYVMNDSDKIWIVLFIILFPFGIYYMKNRYLKNSNKEIIIFTNMLLDFIKVVLMAVLVLTIYNGLVVKYILN